MPVRQRDAVRIQQLRIFAEPLVPVGNTPSPEENSAVQQAVLRFEQRLDCDDFSTLEEFLRQHPDSPWSPALVFNLGLEYYNAGWYSRALASWERSWAGLKSAREAAAKPLADRAAGELAFMYGRLGRMTELALLLKELDGSVLVGPATERIAGARQGLWTMQNWPETAFKCGPFALERILVSQKSTNAFSAVIREAASTTNGLSLSEVAALSRRLGMQFQMAKRDPGAPQMMPAVVHWKVGHYAALLKEENGLYLLQDPTFGNDAWISRRALEAETSGYCLVPSGPLPHGWRTVSESEGGEVFGKGTTSASDPDSTTPDDDTSGEQCDGAYPYAGIRGMAVPDVHLMVVSLNVRDVPVGYKPPVGPPVFFQVTYNQREAGQPATFNYSNLGSKWTFNWLAYIKDNPATPSANVSYYTDGGGSLPFTGFNTNTQTFARQVKTQAVLTRTGTNSYEMIFRSGARTLFELADGGGSSRRVFMTRIIDPQGNAVQIGYDGSFRVTTLTDAIGQVTTISYEHPSDSRKITKVTDPFGRFATFSYDASNRLAQITDVVGIQSQFAYDAGDFIKALTTPYGTTAFEKGEFGRTRWLETIHPDGSKERVEYNENTLITGVSQADPAATVPSEMVAYNNYLGYRNTFYWDRKASAESPNDYLKARRYHWLHFGNMASRIKESLKEPLENRVWFNYDGQAVNYDQGTTDRPKAIGRVLDDGTSQITRFSYDAAGNITNSIDPLGRSRTFIYDTNLVDLLEIRQTTGGSFDLLSRSIYNTQHLAVAIQSASLQWVTNTYNSRGQMLTTRNPNGEVTTFNYDSNGYLLSMDGPMPGTNDSVRMTYDVAGRIHALSDVDGYTITNRYDALDRLTNVTFPDGTFIAVTYDKLDRVKVRNRQGRETQFNHDAMRRLTSVVDPLNRTVRYEYCDCGALAALIDSLGRATRWEYDIQGRMKAKQYPDGSRVNYQYEDTTSRLRSIRDEKGQIKQLEYFADNALKKISYPETEAAMASVSFTYDDSHGQLASMQDEIGTTSWTYKPSGVPGAFQVASVDGPWWNDTMTFDYDALGRITNRVVNGVMESVSFDLLGRATNVVNALGAVRYDYDGLNARLKDITYPNGQTTHFDFVGSGGERRLQQITHRKADNSVISRFAYGMNRVGQVTNWVQELGTVTSIWAIHYDAADQLSGIAAVQNGANTVFTYGYDLAGNRISATEPTTNRTFQYNSLNQLAASSDASSTNVTYEWDADQRLRAIQFGSYRTEFVYDGLGRRRRILEWTNGALESERRYVWVGTQLVEEHDASNNVVQRFFDRGFSRGGTNYFYTRDHLQSVREVTDSAGTVQSRYSYSPFGSALAIQESVASPFGYTGHFRHSRSGLALSLLRPFSAEEGRWLSRDPLGELQGANLYAYVGNNPINLNDPLGACAEGNDPRKPTDDALKELLDFFGNFSNPLGQFESITRYLAELDNERALQQALKGLGNADDFWRGLALQESLFKYTESVGGFLTGIDLSLKTMQAVNYPTFGNMMQAAAGYIRLHPVAGVSLDFGLNLGSSGVAIAANWADIIGGPGTSDNFLLGLGETWGWQKIEQFHDWSVNAPLFGR